MKENGSAFFSRPAKIALYFFRVNFNKKLTEARMFSSWRALCAADSVSGTRPSFAEQHDKQYVVHALLAPARKSKTNCSTHP